MPAGNPEAYGNNAPQPNAEQMRAFTPDAHIRFRSLPREQQYAMLSRYTGTSNLSTLSYAANMARNDPHTANRVMEQVASGDPSTMEMIDDSIGGSLSAPTSQPQPPAQGSAPSPSPSPTQTSQQQPMQQQAPQGDASVGNVVAAPVEDGGIHRGVPMQSAGNGAPVSDPAPQDAPVGVEGAGDLQNDLVSLLMLGGAGLAADQGGKALARSHQNLRQGGGSSGQSAGVEGDITSNIDTQDRIASRQFPQPDDSMRVPAGADIPEPPTQVGKYTIDPNTMAIVDVDTGQIVPEQQAREMLQSLARYLREGDPTALAQFGAMNQSVDTIMSPDAETRLQRMMQGQGQLGDTPVRARRGELPWQGGRTTSRSVNSLF